MHRFAHSKGYRWYASFIKCFDKSRRTSAHTMEKCTLDNSQIGNIVVPSCYDWLITMWHLGTDSISEYDEEKFHCSWKRLRES